MKILFINSNLYGHINPTLGFVRKLTEKENQVDYFCAETFSKMVQDTGAKWIGYSEYIETFLKEYRPTDRHPFYILIEYMLLYDEAVLPEILELIKKEKYDVIICDSIFGAGYFIKQITNIMVVCSHSSFAMSHAPVPSHMLEPGFHPQLDHCYLILKRICEKYKICEPTIEQVFTSKGDLNIVYTTQKFNGDEQVREPQYLFAGPSIDRIYEKSSFDYSLIGDRKLIYISLGSINTNFVDFYKLCIEAFDNLDYFVCMSVGSKFELTELGEIPKNFLVKSFLPQLEILSNADVFITHAGFNSVNEALCFGVPMLALPQVNDQNMVAKRLASMQLGYAENIKELTTDILITKTKSLIMDKSIKENCMKMSQEMKESARLENTVNTLLKIIKDGKEVK